MKDIKDNRFEIRIPTKLKEKSLIKAKMLGTNLSTVIINYLKKWSK